MSDVQCLQLNGQPVLIRSLQLEDIPAVDAMHDRLSKQSLYFRYFASCKPSLEALQAQAHLSQSRGAAFVAVLDSQPDQVVGMAYYLPTPNEMGVAEPALLIEDRFQGQGLGRAMLQLLVRRAQSQSVRCFQIFVLPENQRVLSLFSKGGFPLERRYRDGMYEMRMSL